MNYRMSAVGGVPIKALCGWGVKNKDLTHNIEATQELVRSSFDLWGASPPKFEIIGGQPPKAGGRTMLWETGRKVLGKDTLNYAQQIGDCVSFGCKNAIEYMQFYPMVKGDRIIWTPIFPPYLYGCGRVFIGGGSIWGDGSVGAWQAKACEQFGVVASNASGVPQYSGSLARQWGKGNGPPQNFVTMGKEHLVKTTAPVRTWEDMMAAIDNGYPVTVASMLGFTMMQQSDGFHHRSGTWGHQTCCIGYDDDPADPYICELNSWGDSHGQVKDFKTGDIWPMGTMRIRKVDFLAMIAEQDTFAYSMFNGFPAQELTREDFNLWG